MALTIGATAVDAWALTPADASANSVREGAVMTLSDSYASVVHVDFALGDTEAHTGTKCILQVSSAAADDEFWSTYTEWISGIGTANTEVVLNNPLAAAATAIEVASLTGFTVATGGSLLAFLLDNTVANSEIVRIVTTSVEGGNDLINIMEGVKREHAVTTSVLSNIVETRAIYIPIGFMRARMIYDNLYDVDGAGIYTRTRVVETTALS